MASYTLDTHATVKQLENSGMESRQAEAVVAAISRSDVDLATKQDLAILKADISVRGESRASTETGPAPAGQGATEGAYREYVSR